ncbi:MAG: ribonucleotide-diphosphate reductase subunit beta [Solirubrobacterales bacterium]
MTLLEMTQQGDVATISDDSKLASVTLMEPAELYRLWEKQQWQSGAIDFSQDRRDWEQMGDEQREEFMYGLSAFFVGEERVATQFSGLVMAYESQHEEAFLATQQVDEARHAQHFNNLYEHVLRYDGSFEDRLERARGDLNDAYHVLFDEQLVEANKALIDNPSDLEAKVDYVVLYHMVIEGTLALTGQWFQTQFLEDQGVLPGHVEGFKNISRDEHRHVAYGTWFLQQKCKDPGLARRAQDKLAESLPAAAGVLVPPPYSLGDDYIYMGVSSQQMNEFAFTALTRRLKVIGIGLPAVAA